MMKGCLKRERRIVASQKREQIATVNSEDKLTPGHISDASFHSAGAAFFGASRSPGALSFEVVNAGSEAMFCSMALALLVFDA